MRIEVVHGPNLDLLGSREPEIYGSATLAEIDASIRALAETLGVTVQTFQSNHEGRILDHLVGLFSRADALIINPGGLGHTSVVLRDSVRATGVPFVEVHLSNTAAREDFRRRSLLADLAVATVAGFGPDGYLLALRGLAARSAPDG